MKSRQFELRPLQIAAAAASFFMLTVLAFGQASAAPNGSVNSADSAFMSARPQILVSVRKHRLGADLFEISAVSSSFPAEVLKQDIINFGTRLGSAPRGLMVFDNPIDTTSGTPLDFIKATFAVDGFMSQDKIRLGALAAAFAGGQGPGRVDALDVVLSGISANSQLIAAYDGPDPKSPAVTVLAKAFSNPPGLEYRIILHSQDPAQIIIPDNADQAASVQKTASGSRVSLPVLIGLVLAACVAAGIVVYNLISRGSRRAKPASRSVNR